MYLLSISGDWYIKSYDIAMDLKVSILDIIFDMSGKHSYKIDCRGYDDKTIYLGKGDNRVKIYNKKKESNLNIDGELSRAYKKKIKTLLEGGFKICFSTET